MKTIISTFFVATMVGALCLSVSSCSEEYEMGNGKYKVSLIPHKLRVSSSNSYSMKTLLDDDNNFAGYEISETTGHAMTYNLKVEAENTPWKFIDIPDWITLSPASGNSSEAVTMTVNANSPTETERQVTLALESTDPEWEYSIPITIKQVAASPSLSKKDYFSSFTSQGGTKDCQFSANFVPTIEYEDNSDKWFTASIEKTNDSYNNMPLYTMYVTVSANEETTSRTGYVLLKFGDKTMAKIEVSQYAFSPSSSVSNSNFYISYEGGTKFITYTANFTPEIQYDDIKSWCDVSLDTSAKTVTLDVKPNNTDDTRSGYVYLMYKGMKIETIYVYQYAFSPSASFSSNYLWMEKKGETRTVSYTANFTPTINYDGIKSWCNVSVDTNSKTITITASENTTDWQRSGYIRILYNEKEKASIRIYQYGY